MKNSDGFTIVEVAVTLVVIGIFSIVILMMQTQVSNISVLEVQHTKASYLAYSNMRKYANDSPPTWFECVAPPPSTRPPGSVYSIMSSIGRVDGLPGIVRQEVYVSAPYGCKSGTASFGMPIKVESVVEYGLPSSGAGSGRKVTHATYAAF
jgi:prepilin-type cleavage/methylation N-terminal domain protein